MADQKIIDFMGLRRIAAVLSIVFLIFAVVSLATRGLNFGLDFTGGTLVEVEYEQAQPLTDIRNTLETAGFQNAVVVNFGSPTDVLVRLPAKVGVEMGIEKDKVGERVLETLRIDANGGIELLRAEFVGPQVGEELREQGGMAMLLALAVVMIYIAMRFQFKFAIGAVAALAHDVIIVVGVFSFTHWDFDLTVLAALLAVIGYSLNDTIVVSDRIRENFRKLRKGGPVDIINISLSETLGRTLVTSLTTAMVLAALATVGGDLIRGFALALLVGVAVGTYSSIYVASNIMLAMGINREDLIIPPKEEGEEIDLMP